MKRRSRAIPVYTTKGDAEAFLTYPHLFNPLGEWIGWVTLQREVYSVHGDYVGWLTNEPRILRKKTYDFDKPRREPPTRPRKSPPPATVPLAPLMAELGFDVIDVLYEMPELLPTVDTGEALEDMN